MDEPKHSSEPSLPQELTPARLLIVDDEPHIRSAVARALSLIGYVVQEAETGLAGLQLLEKGTYDLMILDMRMPGLDGMEVMERARESYPELLIIVLTGHATLESAISAVKAGAVDYLLKPVSMQEMTEAVAHALGKRTERLQRRRLMKVIGEALDELRKTDTPPSPAAPVSPPQPRFVQYYPLTLDAQKRMVIIKADQDYTLQLTEGETALLATLMANPDRVLSCSELVNKAWGDMLEESDAQSVVRPHVFRLRRKLETVLKEPRLIHTLRRRGYFFSTRESSEDAEEAE